MTVDVDVDVLEEELLSSFDIVFGLAFSLLLLFWDDAFDVDRERLLLPEASFDSFFCFDFFEENPNIGKNEATGDAGSIGLACGLFLAEDEDAVDLRWSAVSLRCECVFDLGRDFFLSFDSDDEDEDDCCCCCCLSSLPPPKDDMNVFLNTSFLR